MAPLSTRLLRIWAAVSRQSAGLLLYRGAAEGIEVFLVHPGGPFFARKDDGSWSIPKGEYDDGDDPLQVALREFEEETGVTPPIEDGSLVELGNIRQKGGKVVTAWGARGDLDPTMIASNTFTLEWPPRSGRSREFPEIDRAAWFDLQTARRKILPAQAELLDRLAERIAHTTSR
jgi:predicted NUDIX family NTP pyrophosphohydrolase